MILEPLSFITYDDPGDETDSGDRLGRRSERFWVDLRKTHLDAYGPEAGSGLGKSANRKAPESETVEAEGIVINPS